MLRILTTTLLTLFIFLSVPQIYAQSKDYDSDGIPNDKDACPYMPRLEGSPDGASYCGKNLIRSMDDKVFLWSRTFTSPTGFPKSLGDTAGPYRVLLHIKKQSESPVVLSKRQKRKLKRIGVTLYDYLPHYTWYAKIKSRETIQKLQKLVYIKGISKIEQTDRIDPLLLANGGPTHGLNKDSSATVSITFFSDVSEKEVIEVVRSVGGEIVESDEFEYQVKFSNMERVKEFSAYDIVMSIQDIAGPPGVKTANGRTVGKVDLVDEQIGLTGSDITVAMAEPGLVPWGHPDLSGRVRRKTYLTGIVAAILPAQFILLEQTIQKLLSGATHAQFVGSIMAGNGETLPGNRGLLPEAELISYSVVAPLFSQRYYKNGRNARRRHDAAVINHSWGPENLNKPGAYTNRGRYLDRVVFEEGLPVVWAAGNLGRAAFPSMAHPVAKNDISMGNFSIDNMAMSSSSSSGGSADGRLKPDLVAPGNGIVTVDYSPFRSFRAGTFSGTSASAPFASGVVGMMADAFLDQGISVDQIEPELTKAILLETADDIGGPGPDFETGYGMINATEAIRLVNDSSRRFVSTVSSTSTSVDLALPVNEARTRLSATLVWTDIPGTSTSTMTLVNDLDLSLISPSGALFRPFDLGTLPTSLNSARAGSTQCQNQACEDRLNNVEQIVVDLGGQLLEEGNWILRVSANRLTTNSQRFAIATSAACALRVTADLTLSGDLNCPYDPLSPAAVVIDGPAVLDCDGYSITGTGWNQGDAFEYVGVRLSSPSATVRNCNIEQFDTGIKFDSASMSSSAIDNTISDIGTTGILVDSRRANVSDNVVRRVHDPDSTGILVRGEGGRFVDNEIYPRPPNQAASREEVGLLYRAATTTTVTPEISGNQFGGHTVGIQVGNPDGAILNLLIDDNHFEGMVRDAIILSGDVEQAVVSNNTIQGLGESGIGISLDGVRQSTVTGNAISGGSQNTTSTQIGIRINLSQVINVRGNTIPSSNVGISEASSGNVSISNNTIGSTNNTLLPPAIGIRSSRVLSISEEHVQGNIVYGANTGILIHDTDRALINQNTIIDGGTGIYATATLKSGVTISGNQIDDLSSGISISSGDASITGNVISNASRSGITLSRDTGSDIDNNSINGAQETGFYISSSRSTNIVNNDIQGVTGLMVDTIGIQFDGNQCDPSSLISIEHNTISEVSTGLETSCSVNGLTIQDNQFRDSGVAINQRQGSVVSGIALVDNRFESNAEDVRFIAPVEAIGNLWSDITQFRIFDSDNNGYGDCGADFPYTAESFGGASTAENRSELSRQVVDRSPLTNQLGSCP